MATEALKLMAQIVISHASMSELTPRELVDEIKSIYNVLSALETAEALLVKLRVLIPELLDANGYPDAGEVPFELFSRRFDVAYRQVV